MRLWDNDSRALQMQSVAEILAKPDIVDGFVAEVKRQWDQPIDPSTVENFPEEDRGQMLDAIRRSEAKSVRRAAETRRAEIGEAVSLIRKYVDGDGRATLEKLRHLRNKRLAHRDIDAGTAATPRRNIATDQEVENFYQDMAKLIRLLKSAVERAGYDPDETAQIHAKNAALFWASVRGERTEGHPSYRAPPACR